MSDWIWLGSFLLTVWFVVLSWTSESWWPIPYAGAVLLGFTTCLVAMKWPGPLRSAWCLLGIVYAAALPIARTVRRRRGPEWGD